MTQVLTARLSPSGPVIGNPPAQIGGGAKVPGRLWVAQGAGNNANVPGAAAGDVPGLEHTTVDLQPAATGYKYDVEVDVETFGTGGGFVINLLGSVDAGANYTSMHTPAGTQDFSGGGRLHLTNVTNAAATPINRIKVQLQRNVPAAADLTYAPADCCLRVREYSGS